MENRSIWNKVGKIGVILIVLLSVLYFVISYPQMNIIYLKENVSNIPNVDTVGELLDDMVVVQTFETEANYIKGISLEFANYGNEVQGTVTIQVNNNGTVLAEQTIDTTLLPDSSYYYVNFGELKEIKDKTITVIVESEGAIANRAVTLWAGEYQKNTTLTINGEATNATLVIEPDSYIDNNYISKYWIVVALFLLLWIAFVIYENKCEKENKKNVGIEFIHIFDKYLFLLKQLVGRDFKTKYRRSYLGILWSLLSPIFMMIIVSSVFSFIFRFNIEHFPVYLILGQITFSVFSESTQIAGTTITGAGQLIKKVYLPKYIFPFSKVTFSFVNFLLSFVAAAGVMLFYGIKPTVNILYLPLWLCVYYVFTLGISLLLSAMMVFFRDMQHLYSLIILAWGYITPIFYPVSSLSPWMQKIMNLNPLYHYIEYLREILLYGQCPSLKLNVVCIIIAVLSFAIGSHYFYRKQNKFILYI